jgi:hypothetical protein
MGLQVATDKAADLVHQKPSPQILNHLHYHLDRSDDCAFEHYTSQPPINKK